MSTISKQSEEAEEDEISSGSKRHITRVHIPKKKTNGITHVKGQMSNEFFINC